MEILELFELKEDLAAEGPDFGVSFVNLKGGYVLTTRNQVLPIVEMLDADGEPTGDPSETVCAVAGSDAYGWLTLSLVGQQPLGGRVH